MMFKVYICMPFHIWSQRKSLTFHFSWKLFLTDKNICEVYKTEKPTTCVVSVPKNCPERSCLHEFQSSKNIFMYFCVGQSPGPCLWGCSGYRCCRKTTRVLQKNNMSAADLGLVLRHLEDPPRSLGLRMLEWCQSLMQCKDFQQTLCAEISFKSFCVVLGAGCSFQCWCRLPWWGSENKKPGF